MIRKIINIIDQVVCYFNNVFLVVFGRGSAASTPTSRTLATMRMGILGLTRTNAPKMFVPSIAPNLAISR